MIRIKRDDLLSDLEMVKAGLSAREFVEQSACFVFDEGQVMTFNEEIACRKKLNVGGIKGAVQANLFLPALEKMTEEVVEVMENENGELEIRGGTRLFWLTKDPEVFLPIERVEEPKNGDWFNLPKGFSEAVKLVTSCAGRDESKFTMTCVHLHPDFIEACDNNQIMRHKMDWDLEAPVLIRASSLSQIVGLAMDEIAVTKTWVHFCGPAGMTFSCRKYDDEYPELTDLLEFEKGRSIALPKDLIQDTEIAEIFANDTSGDAYFDVSIKEGQMRLRAYGQGGGFQTGRKLKYTGPPMRFVTSPVLLNKIADPKQKNEVEITDGEQKRMRIVDKSDTWKYVTVLAEYEDAPEEKKEEKKEKKK